MVKGYNGDWDTLSEEEKDDFRNKSTLMFKLYEDDLFVVCTSAVIEAYNMNGKADQAKAALDEAKAIMKELSEKYSDYEHYPSLKGYYTTTSSYFDFCENPAGSFDQLESTNNEYRNEARDYIADLDYIFN